MQSPETEQSQTSSCDSSGIAIKRCGQASMWGTISTREEVLITMVPLRFCFLQFQFTTQLTWIQMQMILFLTCGQRISSSLSYVTLLKSFTSLHLSLTLQLSLIFLCLSSVCIFFSHSLSLFLLLGISHSPFSYLSILFPLCLSEICLAISSSNYPFLPHSDSSLLS